ncbi:MAG: lipopolysaccharide export system protein LptA [Paracoccaceae bacterium]
MHILRIATFVIASFLTLPASAQGTAITLGGINADPSAPMEISADSLSVDQDTGLALFDGNVVVGQGDLRLSAGQVRVSYDAETGDIRFLEITGGVTIVTATEAAEAQTARYDLDAGEMILSGEVLVTQGASAMAADRMVVNLEDGTSRLDGRVRTVFQQADN